MNIDLFLTPQSEAGLICEGLDGREVLGVILDAQTHEITLELGDGGTAHLNIHVEESHREKLLFAHRMYVGHFAENILMDSFEVPLLYLNDPYGSAFGDKSPLSKARRSVPAFEQFMRRCTFAQALHRENLGDEGRAGSVLRGVDLNALKLSPLLQRQLQLATMSRPQGAPQMPGMGGSSSVAAAVRAKAKKDADDGSDKS